MDVVKQTKKGRAKTERGASGVGSKTRRVAFGTPSAPTTAASAVRATVLVSSPTPPDVCAMLDEIARLRKALSVFHAESCTLMRSGADCTCGSSAAAAISRAIKLEEIAIRAEALVKHQAKEIAALDLKYAALWNATQ